MNTIRQALVWGLGASGQAAARLLLRHGARVLAVDEADGDAARAAASALEREGAAVRTGIRESPEGHFDLAVVSPGVPAASPRLAALRRRGIPLLAEIELAWRWKRGPVLAVTGSNGKSSAAVWCREALNLAGRSPRLAGNGWTPFSHAVLEHPHADPWVIEVSSFQLETVDRFRPDVGLLLNLRPNHLDRHRSLKAYRRIKMRLFAAMRSGDTAVLPTACRCAPDAPCRRVRFGGYGSRAACRVRRSEVLLRGRALLDLNGTPYDNEIMAPDAAGVGAALDACGVSPAAMQQALKALRPLPHRMEPVGRQDGILFLNNSKATNLAALIASLRMAPGPVRLLAGGLAKESDFSAAEPALRDKARAVYLMGHAAPAMAAAWSGIVPCRLCGTLEKALRRAWREAAPGEVILLAPGAASFDQFHDFTERGEAFTRIVRECRREK